DIFDLDRRRSPLAEIQSLGGLAGNIHDAMRGERPAVIDPYDHRVMVTQIGDACVAWQRQRRMRGGNRIAIVNLAIGRAAAVEGIAIPGSKANRGIMFFTRVI